MPAGDQESVQHLTLTDVPVDVFIDLLSFFGEVKELNCCSIHSPQEVQCVHVQCGLGCTIVFGNNHYLTVFCVVELH